jgi:hypothetical protein
MNVSPYSVSVWVNHLAKPDPDSKGAVNGADVMQCLDRATVILLIEKTPWYN